MRFASSKSSAASRPDHPLAPRLASLPAWWMMIAVIPGTDKPEYMRDNLQAGRGPLPDAAMRKRMSELVEALPARIPKGDTAGIRRLRNCSQKFRPGFRMLDSRLRKRA